MSCAFCDIVEGTAPAEIVADLTSSLVIKPLNPHAPGHVLVVPKHHSKDILSDITHGACLMADAIEYARTLGSAANILTSAGSAATQTVFHTHIHVIPRGPEDGLDSDWPWMRY